ncbi:MAG: PilZ domain-containing protein [Candidatus Omnitrophica bacterium]|nr:PilZ domain-containing protein [Candidatus Omnitrophota bacterium]
MNERRNSFRAGVSFPVECNLLPQRNYFYTVSKDLSVSGIRIVSNDFLSCGNCLKLNINLIDKVVDLKAQVVWCSKERVADRYVAGLKFMEISENNKGELSQLLKKIYNS